MSCLLFPNTSVSKWIKIYNITIPNVCCMKCSEPVSFTTPFAYKDIRGVQSELHIRCGKEFQQSVFVTSDMKDLAIAVEKFYLESL